MAKHKSFKLARQHCLDAGTNLTANHSAKSAEIRQADALDRAARIRAAQSFKERMEVQTPDGKGKVCGVNKRTGSVDVRVVGVPTPRPYAANRLVIL